MWYIYPWKIQPNSPRCSQDWLLYLLCLPAIFSGIFSLHVVRSRHLSASGSPQYRVLHFHQVPNRLIGQ